MQLSDEEKKARIREFTGWIRKVIETRMFNDSKTIEPEKSGELCVDIFTEVLRRVAGNRTEVDLNDPKDGYLIVETITDWGFRYLHGDDKTDLG